MCTDWSAQAELKHAEKCSHTNSENSGNFETRIHQYYLQSSEFSPLTSSRSNEGREQLSRNLTLIP